MMMIDGASRADGTMPIHGSPRPRDGGGNAGGGGGGGFIIGDPRDYQMHQMLQTPTHQQTPTQRGQQPYPSPQQRQQQQQQQTPAMTPSPSLDRRRPDPLRDPQRRPSVEGSSPIRSPTPFRPMPPREFSLGGNLRRLHPAMPMATLPGHVSVFAKSPAKSPKPKVSPTRDGGGPADGTGIGNAGYAPKSEEDRRRRLDAETRDNEPRDAEPEDDDDEGPTVGFVNVITAALKDGPGGGRLSGSSKATGMSSITMGLLRDELFGEGPSTRHEEDEEDDEEEEIEEMEQPQQNRFDDSEEERQFNAEQNYGVVRVLTQPTTFDQVGGGGGSWKRSSMHSRYTATSSITMGRISEEDTSSSGMSSGFSRAMQQAQAALGSAEQGVSRTGRDEHDEETSSLARGSIRREWDHARGNTATVTSASTLYERLMGGGTDVMTDMLQAVIDAKDAYMGNKAGQAAPRGSDDRPPIVSRQQSLGGRRASSDESPPPQEALATPNPNDLSLSSRQESLSVQPTHLQQQQQQQQPPAQQQQPPQRPPLQRRPSVDGPVHSPTPFRPMLPRELLLRTYPRRAKYPAAMMPFPVLPADVKAPPMRRLPSTGSSGSSQGTPRMGHLSSHGNLSSHGSSGSGSSRSATRPEAAAPQMMRSFTPAA